MSNKYNFKIHHRKSIRIKDYNYSAFGYYFITVCTEKKVEYFGKIIDSKMILNIFGKIVANEWDNTKNIRNNIELDEFIVMPNHIHGIIIIRRGVSHTPNALSHTPNALSHTPNEVPHTDYDGGVWQYTPTARKFQSSSNSLGAIIRGFKSAVTKQIKQEIDKRQINIIFQWQRNYYERIIRSEDELNKIRKYIIENPLKWETDKNNTENLFM
ncbi:MAG: transposase [bacterium]